MVSYSTNVLHFLQVEHNTNLIHIGVMIRQFEMYSECHWLFLAVGAFGILLDFSFHNCIYCIHDFWTKKKWIIKKVIFDNTIHVYIRKVLNESTRLATLKKIFVSAILLQSHLSNMEGSGKELLHYKIIPFLLASNTTFCERKFHAAL